MSTFDLAIDAVFFAWVLYRQWRVRRIRLHFGGRVPVFLALFGLAQFFHFTETRSLGVAETAIAIGSCVIGGALFGVLRGSTVRISALEKGAAQQAGLLTTALWVASAGAHLALGAAVGAIHGDTGVLAASGLLYLACTLGVQNAVVHRRAVRFLMAGGGRPHEGVVDARSWESQA